MRQFVFRNCIFNKGILVRKQSLISQITLEPPVGILALRHRPDSLGIESPGASVHSAVQEDVVGILVVQVETFAGLRGADILRYRLRYIPGNVTLREVETCLRVGLAHFGKDR